MKDKGMILISALLISVILLITAMAMSTVGAGNLNIVSRARDRLTAFRAAEAGMARAIYEVNSYTDWKDYSGDPLENPLSVVFDQSNSKSDVFIYNNFKSKKSASGYKGETIPPYSAQVVSIGEAGPAAHRVKRTLVCLLRVSNMETFASATTGSIDSVNGDLMVDGIDSVSTWNPMDGNLHSNKITADDSVVWNGKGVYEADISGKITTISSADTVHFYKNDGVVYDKEFKILGDINVTLPDPLEDMLPPKDTSGMVDLPAPDEEGNITLEEGVVYKYNGKGTETLTIEGKLIMKDAKLYVVDGDLYVNGGLSGEGLVSVSGMMDLDDFTTWKEEKNQVIGTENVCVDSTYVPPAPPPEPDPTEDGGGGGGGSDDGEEDRGGSEDKTSSAPEYKMADTGVLLAMKSFITSDVFMPSTTAVATKGTQYPPGSSTEYTATNETRRWEKRQFNGKQWTVTKPSSSGGYWVYTYKQYDIYEIVNRKYKVNVDRPTNATIKGDVDFDCANLGGASIYTQGLLTFEGSENEAVLSNIKDELKKMVENDILNGESSQKLLSEYLQDTMKISVDGKDYELTGIQEWLENHPAMKYKQVQDILTDNSVVLNVLSQYLCDYLYFQGVIYTEGGLSAKGKIKIIGGIIVKNKDSRAGIDLDKGAMITCNGEYLRIFEQIISNPVYAPMAWHEVY